MAHNLAKRLRAEDGEAARQQMNAESVDEERDMWSNLAHDPLTVICEALAIPDLFVFASVCHSWRCAGQEDKRRRVKVPKPWLMFSGGRESSAYANFYSISEGNFYAIRHQPALASLNTCFLVGSDHGWIIAADERSELLLINPVTGRQIALPPISTMGIFMPVLDESGDNIVSYWTSIKVGSGILSCPHSVEKVRYMYDKACLSSPPSSSGSYTVVVLLRGKFGLAFARSGDAGWRIIIDPSCTFNMSFHLVSYNDAVLHTTNSLGQIQEWDLSSNDPVMKGDAILPEMICSTDHDHYFYLVPTAWGDLLQVIRSRGDTTCRIQVYRVDLGSQTRTEVASLGQNAIFLGASSPVCVSTEDAPALKPDCIYFADDEDIRIYSLKDHTIEPILPNDTRLYWPPPLWFTPSLLS